MNPILEYLITQSYKHSTIIIIIITLLESLTFIELLIPKIILMTSLGTLIGSGKLSFLNSCLYGTIGCLIGNFISYYIGYKLHNWLYNIQFIRKNIIILDKIKKKINNNIFKIIIIGKFIKFTKNLIPVIIGIFKIPLKKIITPIIISSIIYPPLYYFPGILTGIILQTPKYTECKNFIFLLIFTILFSWISIWILIQYYTKIYSNKLLSYLNSKKIKYITIITLIISIILLINIIINPKIILIKNIIYKIIYLI